MMKKTYELIAGLFGAAALVTQFAVSVPAFAAKGMSLGGALVNFFSFFTILTNIAVVFFYLANFFGAKPAPKWQAAMALYMAIVSSIYIVVLQDIWEPQGIFKVLDVSLHYVTPALFVLYWLVFVPKGETAYRDAWMWLVPGLAYVVFALIRGAMTGLYPYPFLDAAALGYARVVLNTGLLLAFFLILSLIVVGLDHALARWKR